MGRSLPLDPRGGSHPAARRPPGLPDERADLQLAVEELVANDPAKAALRRPLFGMYRTIWPDDTAVEFHLPHGEWIRLLRDSGFEIERLVEVQAPDDAVDSPRYSHVTAAWARQWPSEEAWVVRKGG